MTAPDLAALRAAAEKATPGTWTQWIENGAVWSGEVLVNTPSALSVKGNSGGEICECGDEGHFEDDPKFEDHLHNAAHIAAANPAAVLSLLDENAAMREALRDARRDILHLRNARWSECEGSDADAVAFIDAALSGTTP